MYTWIWIEGERALNEFCERRFKARPRFLETIGTVGPAKVHLKYKEVYDDNGDWVRNAEMYLLYMEARPGTTKGNIAGWAEFHNEIRLMTYEEIKADSTAILKR